MKKTNSMRVAVVMLALTLITSCFVGGTFAKYTTSANGGDSARVAKFGVQINAGKSTFLDAYETDDANATFEGKYSVQSDNGEKVVAPGTSGEIELFSISGKPEVAVRINAEMTDVESIMIKPIISFAKVTVEEWEVIEIIHNVGTGEEEIVTPKSKTEREDITDTSVRPTGSKTWTKDMGDGWDEEIHTFTESYESVLDPAYYPIKWTLKKDGAAVNIGGTTLADVQKYINDNINGAEYAPNTDLAEKIGGNYTLKWEWIFENKETEDSMKVFDKYDTTLGDIAAGVYGIYLDPEKNEALTNKEYNLTEAFNFSITVTQID